MKAENGTGETGRRKVSPSDLAALEARAKAWGEVGGVGRARIHNQAEQAYGLYLDFLRVGVLGLDFPRWLARHSGVPRTTCHQRLLAGRALATGSKRNRNQQGLIAELRERERQAVAVDDWSDETLD